MAAINPHVSTRQIQRKLDISKSTVHRILVIYITHNFHLYHIYIYITLTQDLTPDDFRRLVFCNWAQTTLQCDRFFRYELFSDEATFHNID